MLMVVQHKDMMVRDVVKGTTVSSILYMSTSKSMVTVPFIFGNFFAKRMGLSILPLLMLHLPHLLSP